jgi:hypothetical protein
MMIILYCYDDDMERQESSFFFFFSFRCVRILFGGVVGGRVAGGGRGLLEKESQRRYRTPVWVSLLARARQ